MFGCPLYIHNTKEACFVRLRGCPYASIHLDAPMFGHPYVWMPLMFQWLPVSLDVPNMSPCMFGHLHMCGCPLYLDALSTYTTQRKHALFNP